VDRDLALAVKTHAGYSGCDYPREVKWLGDYLQVSRIVKQWREPGSKHYLVETDGGPQFKLVFLEASADWLISEIAIT
jgi:hypothetical protein